MESDARRVRDDVEVILGLSGDDFRNVVLNNAAALAYEVKNLSDEARRRLVEVVEAAWPEEGVRANTERDESQLRFHDRGAYAWLTLAPALDVTPTIKQWADLVTSGAVMTDTMNWLSGHYTEEAALLAAGSCDAANARPWDDLVGAIPDEVRVPDEVVDAIVMHLREPSTEGKDFELWHIGDRFAREGRIEALQALSAKHGDLERQLRPWRARLGETEAARRLLQNVTATLREGKRFDRDEAEWLEGVADRALLPELFDALALAVAAEDESPFGISSAIGRAIYHIGGNDAVRMYDELIASSDDSRFKFLRHQRDEIVQAELRQIGQTKAAEVASRLGVPTLDSGVAPGS